MGNEGLSSNALGAIFFVLVAMIAMTIITAVYFHSVKFIGQNEMVLELVEKHDINPMIIRCMNASWSSRDIFDICSILAKDPKISAADLKEVLSNQ